MTIPHRLTSSVASLAFLVVSALPAKAQVTTYTFTGAEPTMGLRITRNGVVSTFATPKPFPGTIGGSFPYVTFTFLNPFGNPTPFFVAQTPTGSTALNPFFSVYASSFDPSNLALNYLGDAGESCSTTCIPFSVLAPIGNVLVVVNKVTPNDASTFSFETSFAPTAVPEPASIVLLATGLAAMAVVAGRRRRAT